MYRTYYWQHLRTTDGSRDIQFAGGCSPYPVKGDHILDKAVEDGGNNFGRLARGGVMAEYCFEMLHQPLAGITADDWRKFFKAHGGAIED